MRQACLRWPSVTRPRAEPDTLEFGALRWTTAGSSAGQRDGSDRSRSVVTGAPGVGRAASRAAPAAVRAAAVGKAAGMLLAAATSRRMIGPPLNPRSMNTLAVPAALPRWKGGT